METGTASRSGAKSNATRSWSEVKSFRSEARCPLNYPKPHEHARRAAKQSAPKSLGRRKLTALGAGCGVPRRRQPPPRGQQRREPGPVEAAGAQPAEAGEDIQSQPQDQAPPVWLGRRLSCESDYISRT